MGRDSYLTRITLGRSAFGDPLRDENGALVLGRQARCFDDRHYEQKWDDRGHPRNSESERLFTRFCKAQNEVLLACGVVVRKNDTQNRKQKRRQVPESAQLESLDAENKLGFMLKCADRLSGNFLTWWTNVLRRRLMTFGVIRPQLTHVISSGFSTRPVDFLFAGFPAWTISALARMIRRDEITEPVTYMNYLELNLGRTTPTFEDRLWDWYEYGFTLLVEIPFEFISTLQSLGYRVWPHIWRGVKGFTLNEWLWSSWLLSVPSPQKFASSVLLYLTVEWLHNQIGWRLYGLVRQVSIRPDRPTSISIRTAEEDEFVDDASIIGIGRSLTPDLGCRFYGPQSLWPALPIAFPWLSSIIKDRPDREELKNETLERCLMIENEAGMDEISRLDIRERRAQYILSSLASLGVDTEQDFYVDIDRWTREIDFLKATQIVAGTFSTTRDREFDNVTIEIDLPNAGDIDANGFRGHGEVVSLSQALETEPPAVTLGLSDLDVEASVELDGTPSTPEQGIRRAASLTQTTPRPRRRPTETGEPHFDEDMEALLADARKESAARRTQPKDRREFRITRLTTHTADSIAWHASAILTRILLLPVDALYWRSLASWFGSVTNSSREPGALTPYDWSGGEAGRWPYYRTVLLTLGLECLIRGGIWRLTSHIALQYGERFAWGRF